MPEHTIQALCTRSDAISREKGWVNDTDPRPYHTSVALMHSELSEALEDWRNHKKVNEIWFEVKYTTDDTTNPAQTHKELMSAEQLDKFRLNEGSSYRIDDAKPCGIPIELADFVIRVCQRVGTDGFGSLLGDVFEARTNVDLYADFEQLLAELHASLSFSYQAKKLDPNDTEAWLQYLADALAEVFTFCSSNEIDLWAAIDMKEAYNRTRPQRHGGKKV
jgi:hypothetical protein